MSHVLVVSFSAFLFLRLAIVKGNFMIPRIANFANTKAIIDKYGFSFQKRFGQNFLIDTNIIEKIIAGAHITKEDTILEIGPGIGSMTQLLAEAAGKVIAVEIDKKLIPVLEETLQSYENIHIINEDILKLDLHQLIKDEGLKSLKVVANLPYYITTPIIMGLLERDLPIESITVMIQKEVAERMNAVPGTKSYGSLTLAVNYYSETEIVTLVAPGCFIPKPKVGSAVIKLTKRQSSAVQASDEKLMFQLIRGAFAQRRKMFINSLMNSQQMPFDKDEVLAVIEAMGLDQKIRGERLSLEQFCDLSNRLSEIKK